MASDVTSMWSEQRAVIARGSTRTRGASRKGAPWLRLAMRSQAKWMIYSKTTIIMIIDQCVVRARNLNIYKDPATRISVSIIIITILSSQQLSEQLAPLEWANGGWWFSADRTDNGVAWDTRTRRAPLWRQPDFLVGGAAKRHKLLFNLGTSDVKRKTNNQGQRLAKPPFQITIIYPSILGSLDPSIRPSVQWFCWELARAPMMMINGNDWWNVVERRDGWLR